MKKRWKIVIILASLLLLTISLTTIRNQEKKLKFKSCNIDIANNDEYVFIEKEDILAILYARQDTYKDSKLDSLKIALIESDINKHPSVKSSQVYYTIDGTLQIKVKQRTPIVRIISENGDGYYIDIEGMIMPLSAKYNARVPLANGNINAAYRLKYNISNRDSIPKAYRTVSEVYQLAKLIYDDTFFAPLVEQIYVTDDNKMILTPKIGPKEIELGTIEGIEYKLEKIKIFYEKGFKIKGYDIYKRLNVEYSNQVLATRIE
ncbi:MAG: hypothetical protein IPO21_04000 [Bacteroidales bacterium]|nr:hypothetical protein [Bacteroidales bacterium]